MPLFSTAYGWILLDRPETNQQSIIKTTLISKQAQGVFDVISNMCVMLKNMDSNA